MAMRGADSIPYRILTTAIPSARAAPARGRSGPPHRPSAPGAGPARPRQQLVRTPDDPARGDLARGVVEDRHRALVCMHVETDPADTVSHLGASS
jgi:hypothetical protein